jgi:hypothetical protein
MYDVDPIVIFSFLLPPWILSYLLPQIYQLMAGDSSPDYKALFQCEAELRRQAEAQTQPTAFIEFVQACHNLLSRLFQVGTPTKSTKGQIPRPTGKYCPTRLYLWSDCPIKQ